MKSLTISEGVVLVYDQPFDHPEFKGDRTQLFIFKKQLLVSTPKGLFEIPPPWKLTFSTLGEPFKEVIELSSKADCDDDDPYCFPTFTLSKDDAIKFVESLITLKMDLHLLEGLQVDCIP